jgi:hypothetical protein
VDDSEAQGWFSATRHARHVPHLTYSDTPLLMYESQHIMPVRLSLYT